MPTFQFTARDAAGTNHSGTLEADAAPAVVAQLRTRGWLVVNVSEAEGADQSLWQSLSQLQLTGPRSIHVELGMQQIAVMLRGGLTLLSALDTVAAQASTAPMRQVWQEVTNSIQEGMTFSEALGRQRCFPDYVVRLCRVGEQTGVLDSVLERGAQMMESRRAAKRDILTALAYPAFVMAAAIGVAAYMVLYLIPKLGNLLESLGKELPQMTQFLVDVAAFFQSYGLLLAGGIATAIAAFILMYATETGRYAVDRVVLRIPIMGRVLRLGGTITFSQSLSTLLESGITVLESLVTVEQMHYNRYLASQVREARDAVMKGQGLAEPLQLGNAYMPLLGSMTAVGEQSGNLSEVLTEVTRFHQTQMKSTIKQLSAWVTPVVTVVVGVIVGFVYLAFFVALFAVAAP